MKHSDDEYQRRKFLLTGSPMIVILSVTLPLLLPGLGNAFLGEHGRLVFFFDGKIHILFQADHKAVGLVIHIGGFVALAGNDQRRPGRVDQDGESPHVPPQGEGGLYYRHEPASHKGTEGRAGKDICR